MTPMHHRRYQNHAVTALSRTVAVFIAAAVLIGAPAFARRACRRIPTFAVDAAPKPLQTTDPRSGRRHHGGPRDTSGYPPATLADRRREGRDPDATALECCVSAPPVLEFDATAICCARGAAPAKAMNGSARTRHRSRRKGFVWVGNADNDNAIHEIHPRRQIRDADRQIAPARTQRHRPTRKPAETAIDRKPTRSIADGYGNRRVIVFDATTAPTSGVGRLRPPPNDDKQPPYDPKAPVSQQFANPCIA